MQTIAMLICTHMCLSKEQLLKCAGSVVRHIKRKHLEDLVAANAIKNSAKANTLVGWRNTTTAARRNGSCT